MSRDRYNSAAKCSQSNNYQPSSSKNFSAASSHTVEGSKNVIHGLFKLNSKQITFLRNLLKDDIYESDNLERTVNFLRTGVCGDTGIISLTKYCARIYDGLKDLFPVNSYAWINIREGFIRQYNQNIFGAVNLRVVHSNIDDGKFFVLTCIIDSKNNFTYADVEEYKNEEKDEVYDKCFIKHLIHTKELALPEGNESFSKDFISNFVEPSTQVPSNGETIYRYCNANPSQLSIISHSDNVLFTVHKIFKVLQTPIYNLGLEKARMIVLCCISLYNFIHITSPTCMTAIDAVISKMKVT